VVEVFCLGCDYRNHYPTGQFARIVQWGYKTNK
jgi:hypothetical protein